jgi:hypothetical protein
LHSLKDLAARSNSAVEGRVFTGDNLFHPKLYMAQKGNEAVIVAGSFNLTGKGLNHNEEVCIKVRGSLSDAPILSAVGYFEKIWKSNSVSVEEYLLEHPEYKKIDPQERLSHKQREVLQRLNDRIFESSSIKFSKTVKKTFFNHGKQTVPKEFNTTIEELNLCELKSSIPFDIILPDSSKAAANFYHGHNSWGEYFQFYLSGDTKKNNIEKLQSLVQVGNSLEFHVDLNKKQVRIIKI